MLSCEDSIIIKFDSGTTKIKIARINESLIFNICKIDFVDKLPIISKSNLVENGISVCDWGTYSINSFGGINNIEIVFSFGQVARECQSYIINSDDFASGIIVTPVLGICPQIDTIPALNVNDCCLGVKESRSKQKKYYNFQSHDISLGWDKNKKITKNIFTFINQDGIFLPFVKDGNIIFYLII
jgi:hypothetical protein